MDWTDAPSPVGGGESPHPRPPESAPGVAPDGAVEATTTVAVEAAAASKPPKVRHFFYYCV